MTDDTPHRVSAVTIWVGNDQTMTAHAHQTVNDGSGSVLVGDLQFCGYPDDLRALAKAIEDGAMDIEGQLADQARPDDDPFWEDAS